jgi:ATPase family associated with various cellular activities (AAA)
MLDFEPLRDARKAVREFSARHYASIEAFRAVGKPWFKVQRNDPDHGNDRVHHRTTVATCLESLADADSTNARALIDEIAPEFASRALQEPFDNWKSDGAAFVYSRVRTLPAILQFAPETAKEHADRIREHLDFVWANVALAAPDQAVREATVKPGLKEEPLTIENSAERLERTYPANAFHTYWALRTLDSCERLFGAAYRDSSFEDKKDIALLWTQNMLAAQVALHAAESDQADPNQLAWALASELIDPGSAVKLATGELSRQALYKAALTAFFRQQLPSGKWPLGQPLFHYPSAGNAYCYTFETLAELLRPALFETSYGRLLRELLKPHVKQLNLAWEFARAAAQPLVVGRPGVGWVSGHHPHRTEPEGWATASVFSFIQRYRRLLGAYTREAAANELGVRPPQFSSPEKALERLAERGRTWTGGKGWSAGEQIAALFLHPVKAESAPRETIDPDRPLIHKDQARSAILFGPPGTSKTTLAEALAGAVGWDFVEIHASRFLAEGMDMVPRSADTIFARLMELDTCVVLFDEIDELLRNRQGQDADPFGRFLTTSMLPKVATLWEQGRILFFVATNDIAGADPAIKRSQRFDSAVFVAPPSFDVKISKLLELLPGSDVSFMTEAQVEDAITKDDALGYFALLRFDQLDELADSLRGGAVTEDAMRHSLEDIGKRLARSDWQSADRDDENTQKRSAPFVMFEGMRNDQSRDHRKSRVIYVDGEPVTPLPEDLLAYGEARDGAAYLRLLRSADRPPDTVETTAGPRRSDAILRYTEP